MQTAVTISSLVSSTPPIPKFTPTLVKKILNRYTTFENTKNDIYDILIQSTDKSVKDPVSYYKRAYTVDPIFVNDLYKCYGNTDIEDLSTIFLTVIQKCYENNAKRAYLSIDGESGYKKIGIRKTLYMQLKGYVQEEILDDVTNTVNNTLGKNNLFEIYITIQPNGLYFNIGVNIEKDGDIVVKNNDEENTITSYYRELSFKSDNDRINFVRNRIGQERDILDCILYH